MWFRLQKNSQQVTICTEEREREKITITILIIIMIWGGGRVGVNAKPTKLE